MRNLSGHEAGQAARARYELDRLDMTPDVVRVMVPDHVIAFTASFFQGMFAKSVQRQGSRENFLKKYQFVARPLVMLQIDQGIQSSIVRRSTTLR